MSPRWRARVWTLIAMAALAGAGYWVFATLEVSNDITRFLPASRDVELTQLAQDLTRSDLNRTITLTIGAPDRETAIDATRSLCERLQHADGVAWARSGSSPDLERTFYDLYYPRRLLLLSDRPHELHETLLSDQALDERARDLRRRLASPAGAVVRRIAPEDPWLAFPHALERMRDDEQGNLDSQDGVLLTRDGRHGVIFLAGTESAFETDSQRQLQATITREFQAIRHGRDLRLEQSGVGRFAIRSESIVRADITRISIASSIGVLLLFLILFRSPRYIVLSSITLGAGVVAALIATKLIFGQLHGLTLAFGSTLIGAGIDYAAHYVNHHTLQPHARGPFASLREILSGLVLAALTTIGGLIVLAWASFPGLRELAVFTCVGVTASLIATVALVPPWMPLEPRATRLHRMLEERFTQWLHRMRRSRWMLVSLQAIAIVVSVIGLWRLEWVDDIRALNTLDPELSAEDTRVRERVSRVDTGRVVIALGNNDEQALNNNDIAYRVLQDMMREGEVQRIRSLHTLVWSSRLQYENWEVIHERDAYPPTVAALEREGFTPGAFEPFRGALEHRPEPLTPRDLERTPLAELVRPFRARLGDRIALLTLLRGGDTDAIERRFSGTPGIRVLDQRRFMTEAYGEFRTSTLQLIAIGLVIVFLIVLARYRRIMPALASFVPAILATTSALAVIALMGERANLMHLVGMLLVLSIGVDYGVFMVESRDGTEGTTVVGLIVACLSTVLSFGLLGMSENPAMRALGLSSGLGVLFSLVLAPTAWLLFRGSKEAK